MIDPYDRCLQCGVTPAYVPPDWPCDHHSISDTCDKAFTVAGCIWHPAVYDPPFPKEMLSIHVPVPEDPVVHSDIQPSDKGNRNMSFDLSDIITALEEKKTAAEAALVEVQEAVEELEQAEQELNDAIEEVQNEKYNTDQAASELSDYVEQVETLLSQLNDIPSVSVDLDLYVSIDINVQAEVSFDSDEG